MTKYKTHNKLLLLVFATAFVIFMIAGYKYRIAQAEAHEHDGWTIVHTLIPTPTVMPPGKDLPKEFSDYQIDAWVTFYANKFAKTPGKVNHTRQLLHCLLYREAGYGSNKGHGDNGKAGGALQFHNPTWDGYRKIMMKRGLITEIGSRYDMEQAIETTAWAINDGRALAWGPFLRKECE